MLNDEMTVVLVKEDVEFEDRLEYHGRNHDVPISWNKSIGVSMMVKFIGACGIARCRYFVEHGRDIQVFRSTLR